MAQIREKRTHGRAANGLIEIGSGVEFPDSLLIREMKDYRKMSKAELLAWIEKLKSKHATRSKAQRKQAASAVHDREERLRAILENTMLDIMYELPSTPDVKECVISEEAVMNQEKPILLFEKKSETA